MQQGNVRLFKQAGVFQQLLNILYEFLVDPGDKKTKVAILRLIDSEDPESPNLLLNITQMVKVKLVKSGMLTEVKKFMTAYWDVIQELRSRGETPKAKPEEEKSKPLIIDTVVEEKGKELLQRMEQGSGSGINPDSEIYLYCLGKGEVMRSITGKIIPTPGEVVYLRGNPWKRGSVSFKIHNFLREWRTLKELKEWASVNSVSESSLKKFMREYLYGERLFEGCYIELKNGYIRVLELGADDPDIQYLVENQLKK